MKVFAIFFLGGLAVARRTPPLIQPDHDLINIFEDIREEVLFLDSILLKNDIPSILSASHSLIDTVNQKAEIVKGGVDIMDTDFAAGGNCFTELGRQVERMVFGIAIRKSSFISAGYNAEIKQSVADQYSAFDSLGKAFEVLLPSKPVSIYTAEVSPEYVSNYFHRSFDQIIAALQKGVDAFRIDDDDDADGAPTSNPSPANNQINIFSDIFDKVLSLDSTLEGSSIPAMLSASDSLIETIKEKLDLIENQVNHIMDTDYIPTIRLPEKTISAIQSVITKVIDLKSSFISAGYSRVMMQSLEDQHSAFDNLHKALERLPPRERTLREVIYYDFYRIVLAIEKGIDAYKEDDSAPTSNTSTVITPSSTVTASSSPGTDIIPASTRIPSDNPSEPITPNPQCGDLDVKWGIIIGAIVGGVTGPVARGVIVAGAVLFYFWRTKTREMAHVLPNSSEKAGVNRGSDDLPPSG